MLLGFAFPSGDAVRLASWEAPKLPLTGGDLIAMGLTAGPAVARALKALEQAWIAAGFPPETETRALAAQMIVSELRSSQ